MNKKTVFKCAIALILAALFFAMTGCGPDPLYVRVVFIEGVPEAGTVGTPLALTATIRPAFASNKNIVWLVKDARTTEASISGNLLNATVEGIVTIKAIIANGIAEGRDYTQDFKIVFTTPEPDAIFYSIPEMKAWLDEQPDNTKNKPYRIKLNVDDLGDDAHVSGSAGYALRRNRGKYVFLDLSDSTITSIEDFVFIGCTNLTGITIPDSVTSIGDSAFGDCSNLIGITIPNSVTGIGEEAFVNCTSLASVSIPNSVNSIGEAAFNWCTSLTAITVDSGNRNYTSDQGVLYNKNKTTIIQYPAGKTGVSFVIPNSVTSIGKSAFSWCTSLTSITIPASVNSIGESAFSGCTGLTGISIPNSVTSIGQSAFSQCRSLISVTIPNSVTNIEGDTFYDCTNLASVTIGNGVTGIGQAAFYQCANLASVTIGNNVTSIELLAFAGCKSLTSITIPASVNSIRNQAFAACTSLTKVTFDGTINSGNFDDKAFGEEGIAYIGDLREKYLAAGGGIGTYTRSPGGTTWTKE
jgi:hypothetical protein